MARSTVDLELLRTLIEQMDDIPYVATPTGDLLYFGHQCARYGLDAGEIMANGVMGHIHPDDRERVEQELVRGIATGEVFPTVFRILDAAGEVRWIEDLGRVVRDEHGAVTGLAGVLRDITDRKRTEEALRASDERFRNIAAQSFNAFFEVDLAGKVIYASPAMERITGYAGADNLTGYTAHVLEADRSAVAAAFARVVAGEVVEGQLVRVTRRDGSMAQVEINATPIRREGAITGVLGVVRDVTKRRELEERVRQMHKMEAIGNLVGGVSHDFNNMLAGILGHAEILLKTATPGDRVHESARVIKQAAAGAADLARQLHDLARRDRPRSEPVDTHRLARDVAALVSRSATRGVSIDLDLGAPSAVVIGDPAQLQQVLLNLLINARDAVADDGRIAVASREGALDERDCRQNPDLAPGRYLVLAVRDDGAGIDEQVLPRIFEPYFTTKGEGHGSGMGLATVYRVVKNHGGAVRVSSTPGRGSCFEVYLPLAGEPS